MKIVANRLSDYCEAHGILSDGPYVRLPAGTTHRRHAVRSASTSGTGAAAENTAVLYMCFVELQKAYDSVDREQLLWKVLARAGVPEETIAIIRQFHDGMQARVRMDDGELSDWFEVTQGLRQGCVLSPLLFNIFFTAAIEVILVRFSEDDTILKDLVHLEEEAGAGAGTPLARRERRGGLGNVVCRRRRRGIEIPRRVAEDDDPYHGSVWGIRSGSVGEEERDSLDAGTGEAAEKRGITATTTGYRSSGAKVRSDRPVPILGRPCQRRWRTHAGDQLPEQSSVGMHQEVLLGALRPAESTVKT